MAKLNKNVFYLGLTSLFTDIGSEMIFPILPLFLAGPLGLSMVFIGLIQGIAEATASFLRFVSGYVSDKTKKRKSIILLGYSISTISKPLLAYAGTGYQALGLRFADRLGKGTRESPRDALICDSSTERGKAFGLHRSLDTIGAAIGNIIAFIALYYFALNYQTIFKLSFIPGIIAVLIVLFLVKEIKIISTKFKKKALNKEMKKFLFVSAIFNFAHISYAFFILRATELHIAIVLIPLTYLLYNIFYSSFAYPIGKYSDKHGRKMILAFGYLLFSLICLGFVISPNSWLVWLLFPMFGVEMAIGKSISKAFVSDLVPKSKEATGFGLYHAVAGMALLPGNIFAGYLWESFGSIYSFLTAAVISALACVIFLTLFRKRN